MTRESRSEADANLALAPDTLPPDFGLRDGAAEGYALVGHHTAHGPMTVLCLALAAALVWLYVLSRVTQEPPASGARPAAAASAPASGVRKTDARRVPAECVRPAARVMT